MPPFLPVLCKDYDAGYSIINTDWNPLYLVHSGNAGFAAGPEALSGWDVTKVRASPPRRARPGPV